MCRRRALPPVARLEVECGTLAGAVTVVATPVIPTTVVATTVVATVSARMREPTLVSSRAVSALEIATHRATTATVPAPVVAAIVAAIVAAVAR